MSPYSPSNAKELQSPSKPPPEGYPEGSIKKIAVLFTDIVGSSKFFKSHGDLAGLRMLQKHQDIVTPAIVDHGGSVVKFLGDSVLAYFLNPKEALKSGIKIQQNFQRLNQGKNPKTQIHVRVCVHYGDGIIDDNDIFGDVVNIAAKFLPMVGGDQIFISQEEFDQVQGLSFLNFETVDTLDSNSILEGVNIYKVDWDEKIILDPIRVMLLYIKPVWKLGKVKFPKVWDMLIEKKDSFWSQKVEKLKILPDKSFALTFKESLPALASAKKVIDFLSENLVREGYPFLPLQILIDSGPYLRADKVTLEDLKVSWEEITPGEIHISPAAYDSLKNDGNFSLDPPPDTVPPQSFYKLNMNTPKKGDSPLFLYQDLLIMGEKVACFYCGDKRHLAINCPSKQLPEITHGLDELGYLPLDQINKLFFKYLTGTVSIPVEGADNRQETGLPTEMAHYGFFELKKVFQIRLLKLIWNAKVDRWSKIQESKYQGDKGGLIWIGQDCIRVSNLDKAESVTKDALEKDPKDYRAHCIMGFLNVEKNDFIKAESSFEKALENAKTKPHKIYIFFLLSRLHAQLNNSPLRAQTYIKKILSLDPYCSEASYQEIISKFQEGHGTEALSMLMKLIERERDYYVNGLIDPGLADYSHLIHPALKSLLGRTRNEAKRIFQEAENEVKRLKTIFSEDTQEIKDIQFPWQRINELSKTDSYFSYLDVIYFSGSLIRLCRGKIDERRKKLFSILNELKPFVDKSLAFSSRYPYPLLVGSSFRRLKLIQSKIDKILELTKINALDKLKDAPEQIDKLSLELNQIQLKLRRLSSFQEILLFFRSFFKKMLFFQAANLLLATLILPIAIHYIKFLMPASQLTIDNIWPYQKGVIILGGILSLLLAFLITVKGLIKR
ncbi:MAG: adenylate/guanylate cyclase domain-containing protein [Pseudomonadota bacterium]